MRRDGGGDDERRDERLTVHPPPQPAPVRAPPQKYIRKQSVHDYLRVIADGKVAYKLVYFKLDNDKKDEE